MQQIILESDNQADLKLILDLAKRLNIKQKPVLPTSQLSPEEYEILKKQVLEFEGSNETSFGDASVWQRKEREERI
jgi:putative cell wall-binding protein